MSCLGWVIIRVCREEGLRALVSKSFIAPLASGTMVKSKCEAKRNKRRTRRGRQRRFLSGEVGCGLCELQCLVG